MTEKLKLVKKTYDFGYCPIVFISDIPKCLDLWIAAKELTNKEFPDFTAHSWRIGENDKPILVYSQDNYHNAILFFWKKLEELSGKDWLELKKYFFELSSDEVSELNKQ